MNALCKLQHRMQMNMVCARVWMRGVEANCGTMFVFQRKNKYLVMTRPSFPAKRHTTEHPPTEERNEHTNSSKLI